MSELNLIGGHPTGELVVDGRKKPLYSRKPEVIMIMSVSCRECEKTSLSPPSVPKSAHALRGHLHPFFSFLISQSESRGTAPHLSSSGGAAGTSLHCCPPGRGVCSRDAQTASKLAAGSSERRESTHFEGTNERGTGSCCSEIQTPLWFSFRLL